MKIGYARVSTLSQNPDRQIDLLKEQGCEEIFVDKCTGKTVHRSQFTEMKRFARKGDTIYVESWSRLSRSVHDLINIVKYFDDKQVRLVSLKENFDTSTPQGKLMLNVFAALSEFELDLIKERTNEGIKAAKARGQKMGRPRLNGDKIDLAVDLKMNSKYSVKQISEMTGVSISTIYREIDRRREEERMKKEK